MWELRGRVAFAIGWYSGLGSSGHLHLLGKLCMILKIVQRPYKHCRADTFARSNLAT